MAFSRENEKRSHAKTRRREGKTRGDVWQRGQQSSSLPLFASFAFSREVGLPFFAASRLRVRRFFLLGYARVSLVTLKWRMVTSRRRRDLILRSRPAAHPRSEVVKKSQGVKLVLP